MKIRIYISRLIMNPGLLRIMLFFRPRRFLIRLCSSSLLYNLPKDSVVDVVGGYGKGLKMILNIKDKTNPQNIYYWLGLHEVDVQRSFRKLVKPGFVIYDIGAYIGFFSLLAARLAGPTGRVYSFEPLAENGKRINEHISLNKMQNIIFCIPKPVTDKIYRAAYYCGSRNDWVRSSGMPASDEKDSRQKEFTLETITLDEFIFRQGHPPPNLIKIDTEGEEGKVLIGARKLLEKFKPMIICEIHNPSNAKQAYDELSGFRYSIKDSRGNRLSSIAKNNNHIIALP